MSRRRVTGLAVIATAGTVFLCLAVGIDDGHVCRSSSAVCDSGPISLIDNALGVLTTMGIGFAAAFALSILWQARRHRRLARLLATDARPATVAQHPVLLVPGLTTPFVAGLARPQIYCPADLSERLTAEEMRAVVLHERHHQMTRAPMRLISLAALGPVTRPFAPGRRWSERRRAAIEIAADAHALRIGVRRPELARALLKLGPDALDPGLPSYVSAADMRLRHLLDGTEPAERGLEALVPLMVILGSAVICAARGLAG